MIDLNFSFSQIFLLNEPIATAEQIAQSANKQFYKIFYKENFGIESANAAIDEAYIAQNGIKRIIIAGNTFTPPAQNALLKSLEEPPRDVLFGILCKQKSAILQTIRSRLPITNARIKIPTAPFKLNFSQINLQNIYNFLHELDGKFTSADAIKKDIESLFVECVNSGLKFNSAQIAIFENSLFAANCGARASIALGSLLLMILELKKSQINSIS